MKLFYSYSSACFTGISFLMFLSVTLSLYVPVQGFVTNKSMRSLYRFLPQEVPDPYNVKRHATLQKEELSVETTQPTVGSVTIIIPSCDVTSKYGSKSPVDNPTYAEAASQLANKVYWFSDGTLKVNVIKVNEANNDHLLLNVDVLIALGISSLADMESIKRVFEHRRTLGTGKQCQFTLDCVETLPSIVGPYDQASPSFSSTVLPWTNAATGFRMQQQMMGLFDRWTSDDFSVALMIFVNHFIAEIPWVKYSIDATWEKGPLRNAQELYAMVSKCGNCIENCLKDENCKQCIDALNAVDTRDQVASYRTIVSFESVLLKDFSYCILTKNNIFGCQADIPQIPTVQPVASWRGEPLTVESAQSLLVGHLDDDAAPVGSLKSDISWKVAAGANVAYDQFPSQNQLFYPTVNGRDMWYDPVFRVETMDGRVVWCKRHYKVRNGPIPGTFKLSVLDNGVTSNEFWTIAGVADDLSWIVFHYAGAASAVGQRYLGGLVCTPDGAMPPANMEIWNTLRSVGIEPWELFCVDNDLTSPGAMMAGPPPLDFYRDDVRKAKHAKQDMTTAIAE